MILVLEDILEKQGIEINEGPFENASSSCFRGKYEGKDILAKLPISPVEPYNLRIYEDNLGQIEREARALEIAKGVKGIPQLVLHNQIKLPYEIKDLFERYNAGKIPLLVRQYIEGTTADNVRVNKTQTKKVHAIVEELKRLGLRCEDICGSNTLIDASGEPWLIDLGETYTVEEASGEI